MRSLIVALVLLGMASPALSQSTVVQAGPTADGHVPMYLGTTQGLSPTIQDSGTAAGGGVGVGISEMGLAARGFGDGPYANAGSGPNGENWCDYDGPITGEYHYLCLSPNALSNALISVGSGGGATTLPLSFAIDGIVQPLGTVASVGLAMPAQFAVTGSPVTSTGTLTASWNTQSANAVLSGPTTGAAALPTFRALVGADLPLPGPSSRGGVQSIGPVTHQFVNSIGTSGVTTVAQPDASDLSGTLTIGQGGTGQTTANTALNALLPSQAAQSGKALETDGTNASWVAVAGTGTVTSVALTAPSEFSVAGSPVTAAGTLALSWANPVSVANGGTGLASGTSGGILGYTGATTLASSIALTQHAIVIGGGAGATPTPLASLGTTTTVLHGNASGDPTFGAVALGADVSGTLPIANGGTSTTTAPGSTAGRLQRSSGTIVCLNPFNGNHVVTPAGLVEVIGSSGVCATISSLFVNGVPAQTLVAATLYYVYLFDNSGTPTLDFSTTGHATDATTGIEIKSGTATRVLVGMVYPTAGPVFVDTTANRLVASWFNRQPRQMLGAFTADRTTTNTGFVEINTEIRTTFITWGDAVQGNAAVDTLDTGGTVFSNLSIDGSSAAGNTFGYVNKLAATQGSGVSGTYLPSEGLHYLTILGAVSTGTGTWFHDVGGTIGSGYITGIVVM